MATDPLINEQQLIDAAVDVETIEDFVNENMDITSRLGASYRSLAKISTDTAAHIQTVLDGGGLLPLNKSLMNAVEETLWNCWHETSSGLFKQLYRRTVTISSVISGLSQQTMGINGQYFELGSVRMSGTMWKTGTSNFYNLSYINYSGTRFVSLYLTGQYVSLYSNYDFSDHSATVQVIYAKTTQTGIADPVGIAGPAGATGDPLTKTFDSINEDEQLLVNQFWQTSASGKKPLYHKVFAISALPNTTFMNIAHGVTLADLVPGSLEIRGAASNSGQSISLPHFSLAGGNVSLEVNGSNIFIQTESDRSGLSGFVELVYAKTADSEV